MIQKRILVLSTYPIKGDALTGGPLRVKAIVDNYKKNFSAVKHVAIFSKYHHPTDYAPTDIAVTGTLAEATRHAPNTSDFLIGQGIETDAALHRAVKQMIEQYRPDVIEVEQVYPYIGLRSVLKELSLKPTIVHSSHNVEYPMKQEILESLNYDKAEAKDMVEAIKEAEIAICKEASLVVAVTRADGEMCIKMGAKNYVLARNGMEKLVCEQAEVDGWRDYFASRGIKDIALFVGSAHPPNMIGFHEMLSTGMGYIPTGAALVLAGGVGTNIIDNLQSNSVADVTAHRRLIAVGRLSDTKLNALIKYAKVIVLPITEGGGSNLKTAQAILAQKKTVATSKAFRSFEEFSSSPLVTLKDEPSAFRSAVGAALNGTTPELSSEQKQMTKTMLWECCLGDMIEAAGKL